MSERHGEAGILDGKGGGEKKAEEKGEAGNGEASVLLRTRLQAAGPRPPRTGICPAATSSERELL